MKFTDFYLTSKQQISSDSFVFRLQQPDASVFHFAAGQYAILKNPLYLPSEMHPFSIASSPFQKDYLEFCIKVYGDWTGKLAQLDEGSMVKVFGPKGNFIWDSNIEDAVFLLGGIGISPIISMLRALVSAKKKPRSLTVLYGNRTPETIAYKDELEELALHLPLKVIHIFSHITDNYPWGGYRGFITKEIIMEEIDLSKNPTFFMVGPEIFIEKMTNILFYLKVPVAKIKKELLSK